MATCKRVIPKAEAEYDIRLKESELLKLIGLMCHNTRGVKLNLCNFYIACATELHKNGTHYLREDAFTQGYKVI